MSNKDIDEAIIEYHTKGVGLGGISNVRAIVKALNQANIETPKGGAWHPSTVARLVARLA